MNRFTGVFFCVALLLAPLSAHSLTLKKGETLAPDGSINTLKSRKNNQVRDKEYRTFEKLPCEFNGAKVGSSGYPPREQDKSYKNKIGRCGKESFKPPFYSKDGTSIRAPYGSPVVAIADMEFYYGLDFSAEYRCVQDWYKKGFTTKKAGGFDFEVPDPANPNSIRKCQKPYDGVELVFRVSNTGELVKYYHLSSTPIVPGFGKGSCKKPLMKDRVTRHTRYPEDCGGIAIKTVKKGDIVGFVGGAGGSSIGLNIFQNGRWLIAPEDHTKWESSPRNSDYFLLPVVQNPKSVRVTTNGGNVTFYDVLVGGLKDRIIQQIKDDRFLRDCIFENSNIKEGSWKKFYKPENMKLALYHTVTSRCFPEWQEKGAFTERSNLKQPAPQIDKTAIRKAIRTDPSFRECLANTHIGPDHVNTAVLRNMSDTAQWVVEEAAKTACVADIL